MEQTVVRHYCQIEKKLWKGHRLIGIDGSTANLPPSKDIISHFGLTAQTDTGIKRSLARISFCYDLLNDFVVNNNITPMNEGEKTHFLQSITEIEDQNDIYILDRGYGHYNTALALLDLHKNYCIRFSATSNFIKQVLSNPSRDFITEWYPSEKEKENSRNAGMKYRPIKVRATKIKLNTGETEILISSLLDQDKYSYKDISWLYSKRWIVEEGFKKLKPKMKIEHFGCRKAQGIYQEFYAHIFVMNIVAFMRIIANRRLNKRTCKRKFKYQTNWQNAYRIVRENILKLFFFNAPEELISQIVNQISFSVIAYIPDKRAVRDTRNDNKRGRIGQYYK